MSRSNSVKKNFKFDMTAYLFTQLLSFFNKFIFVKFLGEELLGVNSLFASILAIISVADLGIGNVFVVHLYRPLKEKNIELISSSLNYFKKIYKYIILIVCIFGFLLVPFLSDLIDTNISNNNLVVYYILYLLSIIVTYFSMCSNALLHADQKHYVISKYSSITLLIQNAIQFLILFLLKNYLLFLVVQIFTAILYNILIKKYVDMNYKYTNLNSLLEKKEKKKIFSNTKDMTVYKISCIALNATDNILIASIINVASVGLYSIYTLLTSFINSVLSVLSTSMAATIGEISVSDTEKEKYLIYKKMQLFYSLFAGLCFIGLLIGSNDFVSIIFGNKYAFDFKILLVIVLNFYLIQIIQPIFLFRENAGYFKEVKYIMATCAIINLILSFILGKICGIFGILLATFIARITTTFWYEAKVVYKKIFNKEEKEYYIEILKNFILLIIISIICFYACSFLRNINVLNFMIKEIISCSIYCIIIFIFYHENEEFKFYLKIVKKILKRGK